MVSARRALLSVSNKTGLIDLARSLEDLGIEIVSTGGTAAHLAEAGVSVHQVSTVTGFPEILGGRVKTLHPMIHGGILADRGRAGHLAELQEHSIVPIDLVVVNLYPFAQTAARSGASEAEIIENIDIGGPCLLRAAAKNFRGVVVVVDPEDYAQVRAALETGDGAVPEAMRRSLALKAFRHTQAYDAAIASWMEARAEPADALPRHWHLELNRVFEPRYGENPHQRAAVYRRLGGSGLLGGFEQLHGKELSYNNLLDTDAARNMVATFEDPATIIVKHNNPCGVGQGSDLAEAYAHALATDPVSAFGSIVAFNRDVDAAAAEAMADLFVEVVVAPGFSDDALEILQRKKNLRLLRAPLPRSGDADYELRSLDGGLLVQQADNGADPHAEWTYPTKRQPEPGEAMALDLAWKVCRFVKSNAIVIANERQAVGIGAGQMSRVDSCRLAIEKARLPLQGTAAASDAFFPVRDGLDTLAEAGVRAIIQPGGSRRDDEVIEAADEHGLAMVFTGRRHFRH